MERETSLGPRQFLVTIHPSAVLRADDRDAAYAGLVADLRVAASVLTRMTANCRSAGGLAASYRCQHGREVVPA